MSDGKPIVLVLCTGNSCRSQMAEGFLRRDRGEEFETVSAGTEPKDQVHPLAVQVMAEIGIDISRQKPKNLSLYFGKLPVRHLLIVCDNANGTCPRIWPGAFTRDYLPFEDPAGFKGTESETLEVFRHVRDAIEQTLRGWQPKSPKGF